MGKETDPPAPITYLKLQREVECVLTYLLYVLTCQSLKNYLKENNLYTLFFLVPGPPADLNIQNLNLDSLIVKWVSPVEYNGHLTGYLLKYQPSKCELGHVLCDFVADL